jgi:hypothetical protein
MNQENLLEELKASNLIFRQAHLSALSQNIFVGFDLV